MKKIILRISSIIPALALVVAVTSAQSACWFLVNQPDLPEALKKYDN